MKAETKVGLFVIFAIGIFFYLSINIGAFRLDESQYNPYRAYFEDTGGLESKSAVKIAGVDVGWVESINLQEAGTAEVNLRIRKTHKLARNAYATIEQEGIIGIKSIEIDPGDVNTGQLPPGSSLSMPGKSPASMGELLEQFRDIASGIQDLVVSFKGVFSTREGEENLKLALNNVANATDKMANFSGVLERVLQKNEENINYMLHDFKQTAHHLKKGIPAITDDFHGLTENLNIDILPSFKTDINKVTLAMADDTLPAISGASKKVGNASTEISQTFNNLNESKGTIGKLINDDEVYHDLKKTVKGAKKLLGKADSLDMLIDLHTETLFKTHNSKGYFEVKIRPSHDYFYQLQLVADEYGSIRRTVDHKKRYDKNGTNLLSENLSSHYEKMYMADKIECTQQVKNDILFGFQFGKRWNNLSLRVGMFENAFGFACDYYVPLHTNKVHWITTLEAFDFRGEKRLDDNRPHIKWINKLFFFKNLYSCFGIDDIYSKESASPFFGGGIKFDDNDVKYLLSFLSVGSLKK